MKDVTLYEEAITLRKAICCAPGDDVARLVYSDWLEEHGQLPRAEFIRCQIACPGEVRTIGESFKNPCSEIDLYAKSESIAIDQLWRANSRNWFDDAYTKQSSMKSVVSRGFIGHVSMTIEEFFGHPCFLCRARVQGCSVCYGLGIIGGIASELFARWPIQLVRLTNVRPYRCHLAYWSWQNRPLPGVDSTYSIIPPVLFSRLKQEHTHYLIPHMKLYTSEESAILDLQSAVLSYGRIITPWLAKYDREKRSKQNELPTHDDLVVPS